VQAMAFEGDGIADTRSAPAHEQGQSPQTGASVLDGDISPARIAIDVRCVDDSLELVGLFHRLDQPRGQDLLSRLRVFGADPKVVELNRVHRIWVCAHFRMVIIGTGSNRRWMGEAAVPP
jgi:hypothetical protein